MQVILDSTACQTLSRERLERIAEGQEVEPTRGEQTKGLFMVLRSRNATRAL